MKNYLFFDVETTGVNSEWDNVVQLAAVLTNNSGEELAVMDQLVRPDGFTIPYGATAIHGITTEMALQKGIALNEALSMFFDLVEQSDYLVAHNFDFDYGFLKAEISRTGMQKRAKKFLSKNGKRFFCTMRSTTKITKIGYNRRYGSYKWPKLEELHRKLFRKGIDGAHNALVDVRATSRCFFELRSTHDLYL